MEKWNVGNDEVTWTSEDGQWIPADLAQQMYEALEMSYGIMKVEQFYTAAKIIQDALKAADGEE